MPIPIIKIALKRELEGKHYVKAVDLGCGPGESASILRAHVDYLVGVDFNEDRLRKAAATQLYDTLVFADVRSYVLSSDVDLVCFMEVLEHVSHEDGELLLNNLQWVSNMILSTPRFYFRIRDRSGGGHVSLWTEEELQRFGFQTRVLHYLFYPQIIFATRYF